MLRASPERRVGACARRPLGRPRRARGSPTESPPLGARAGAGMGAGGSRAGPIPPGGRTMPGGIVLRLSAPLALERRLLGRLLVQEARQDPGAGADGDAGIRQVEGREGPVEADQGLESDV